MIIKRGDLLIVDIDKELLVPRKLTVHVFLRASDVEKNDGEIRDRAYAGLTAEEFHDRDEYFSAPHQANRTIRVVWASLSRR